jgi:predicted TIM-barrel fold metal-dependent hydrolase
MIIDAQTHWYPRPYFEWITGRDSWPKAYQDGEGFSYEPREGEVWPLDRNFLDLDVQLADAAASGVDAILTSPAVFGDVGALDLKEGIETCRMLNDQLAWAEREYPGRVYGAGVVPMQDADAAIAELDRLSGELGLRAVCLHTNIGGRRIGTRATWPLYERIQELGLPIFLHPTYSIAAPPLQEDGLEGTLGFMLDSSVGALSLIYGGVLDAYPQLRVVHPHLGGMLPYVQGRIMEEDSKHWSAGRRAELTIAEYLARNFWTDTVSLHEPAFELARDTYGLDHMLFSSDYPYWPRAKGVAFVRDCVRNADEADRVLGANLAALLGLDTTNRSPA